MAGAEEALRGPGRILVTGASGMLGASFVLTLRRHHEVAGTYWSHPVALPGIDLHRMDLQDAGEIARVVAHARPDIVIHAGAMTNLDLAEEDPALAEAVNVTGTAHVARAATRARAALVVVSTDAVFDGAPGPRTEDDEPRPLNVYGRTKLEGERAALAEHRAALVVRTTPVGFGPRGDQLASWILGRLRAGQEVPGFVDAIFSPIDADALCARILTLLRAGARGVLHVAGGSRVSKHAFAEELAGASGFDPARVVRARLADASFTAPRGADMSLDSRRAEALIGTPAPRSADVARALAELDRAGRPAEAAGMLAAAVTHQEPTR
jgi:dTDP-4-dehydrorhamnose reductase